MSKSNKLERSLLIHVKEISKTLEKQTLDEYGIKFGNSGISLFYFIYGRYFKDQNALKKGEELLEATVTQLIEKSRKSVNPDEYAEFGKLFENTTSFNLGEGKERKWRGFQCLDF